MTDTGFTVPGLPTPAGFTSYDRHGAGGGLELADGPDGSGAACRSSRPATAAWPAPPTTGRAFARTPLAGHRPGGGLLTR